MEIELETKLKGSNPEKNGAFLQYSPTGKNPGFG
jgi:hypothetical protein